MYILTKIFEQGRCNIYYNCLTHVRLLALTIEKSNLSIPPPLPHFHVREHRRNTSNLRHATGGETLGGGVEGTLLYNVHVHVYTSKYMLGEVPKDMVFEPFWSEKDITFNHLV